MNVIKLIGCKTMSTFVVGLNCLLIKRTKKKKKPYPKFTNVKYTKLRKNVVNFCFCCPWSDFITLTFNLILVNQPQKTTTSEDTHPRIRE